MITMLNLIVGIAIFLFIFLGLREGIVKSLGSVALVFVALFLASGTLNFLAKGTPQFGDPNFLWTTIVFLLIWALSYIVLDLLLTLLFKKVIKIVILGPLDRAGGLLIGGFKGLLICGIILQLVLYLPISQASKKKITESVLSRFSISVYHWAYPYAKKIAPVVDKLIKGKVTIKVEKPEHGSEGVGPDKYMGKIAESEKLSEQEQKIRELIKKEKLLPSVPQGAAK